MSKDCTSTIGLPAEWFHDDELLSERVRLLHKVYLGEGVSLRGAECFVVSGVAVDLRTKMRRLLLTNHRAKCVPVPDLACELLFCWPANIQERKPDGR